MPAISFSKFVIQLKNGSKRQTTRHPRKNPLRVEDVLKCYYKQRAKKSCNNCLNYSEFDKSCVEGRGCSFHFNFFGYATITEIIYVNFSNVPEQDLEQWAIDDGFESFKKANEWFGNTYGPLWTKLEWEIITFSPWWVDGPITQKRLDSFDEITSAGDINGYERAGRDVK